MTPPRSSRRLAQPARRLVRRAIVGLGLALVVLGVAAPPLAGAAGTPAASPAASQTILLTGQLQHPGPVTVAQLQQLPHQTVRVAFGSGKGTEHHTYVGVRLAAVLTQAGLVTNPAIKNDALRKYLVITANDGYEVVLSWGELDPAFGNAPILLAWAQDGQPLTGTAGPVRLVVPGDVKGGRYVTGVVKIAVRSADGGA